MLFLKKVYIPSLTLTHTGDRERYVVHVGRQFKDLWEGKPTLYEEGLGTGNPAGKGS